MDRSRKILSTKQVAEILGVSEIQVRKLIYLERLPATKLIRDWAILESDVQHVTERRKPGRPPKIKEEKPPEEDQNLTRYLTLKELAKRRRGGGGG